MTLDEILAELNKLDRAQVVTGLQAQAQPIFQAIFDKGVGFQQVKFNGEKATLDGQIATLTATITQKDTELTELTKKTPDVATLRTQYEGQINQLKAAQANELSARDEVLKGERRSRSLSDLRAKLTGAGVDVDYADVLVNKSTTTKRFGFDDKGQIVVYAADSEVPINVASGKDVLDVLADELKTGVPAKFVTSNGDRGSDTSGSGGKGSKSSVYDDIRKEAADKKKAAGEKPPSARERLGMVQR
jgi:hypothetical protein